MPLKNTLSKIENRLSRRGLLRGTSLAAAAAALRPFADTAQAEPAAAGVDYYAKLGVDTIINAAGTYTYLTAAVMPPQVVAAVAKAAQHPVVLAELQQAAGKYLAQKLRCEAVLITSGASAALTLSTAACIMAANSNARPETIPQEVWPLDGKPGMKNEVIVQKAHRYEYDHAMQLCGVKIVEVVTLEDYKRAFTANTIMTNFFNSAEDGQINRETWLRIAHEHKVPCHLDAAADMPPIENLWKYTGMGFDLVCFSGGKGIRGPQNAGLLLGSKKLIELATQNDSPNSDAVGRGMKVAKEQIVGMVAAVDWLLEQNNDSFQAEYMRRTNTIRSAVHDIPTMKAEIYTPEVANHVPHLILSYDLAVVGVTPKQVQERLRAMKPRIELNPATGTKGRFGPHSSNNSIVLATWMLQPGEAEIVGRHLHQVLSKTTA
jgi:L-seryl-tRNA(Ser) seleniumtransferase